MEKLTRHSLYLALFLGTLLTVAGLCLYPELSAPMVLITVLAIMAGVALVAWTFFSLADLPKTPAPSQPHDIPEESDVAV